MLEVLKAGLSEVDWAVLRSLYQMRVATGWQLQQMHFTDASPVANARRARRRLEQLTATQIILRLPRRVGGLDGGSSQFVYMLGAPGLRLVDPERRGARRPWVPQLGQLRHSLATAESLVLLRLAEAAGQLRLLEWTTEPVSWRRATGVWKSAVLKPDAFVRLDTDSDEVGAFLEVDNATESLPVIRRKADAYWRHYRTDVEQRRYGYFPEVLWLVPDTSRRDRMVTALGELPPEQWQLNRVALQTEVAAALVAVPP